MMRWLFLVSLLSLACSAQVSPTLPKLKSFHLETALAAAGRSTCVVAVPDDPQGHAAGQRVATAIAAACGARPEVRPAAELNDADMQRTHVVALGLFTNNILVNGLYLRKWVLCDYSWPVGDAAYVLRTVHNPWLSGTNVVYLGSATNAGLNAAVDAFITALAACQTPGILPPLLQVHTADTPPILEGQALEAAARNIENESSSRSMGGVAARYATLYFQSGDACWANLFVQAMIRLDQLQEEDGAADDVRTCRYIFNEFDRIEEGPAFTPEQRATLSHIFYRFAQRLTYARAKVAPSTIPHGNNWNAIGASYAGFYYTRYYPELELGWTILRKLDVYYAPNMAAWKVNEDCPGYGNITFTGNIDWALGRPVPAYVEQGTLARMADFNMLITTNQGRAAGIGDYGGLNSSYLVGSYPLAGWLYRDGRYLWWWDHHGMAPTYGWVPPEVVPRIEPRDLLGIAVAPLDSWIYGRTTYEPTRQFPAAECFDKVSFRSGFDPADEYLCMSGFGYGFHSHPDANAIINFTARGQTFLYDDGYMIPSLREHNTITIVRDGWAAKTPELARILVRADFPEAALFGSRLQDYNGMNWDRYVAWYKPGHFVVLDRLEAQTAGEYGLQCIWRTLGKADLEGRRWSSRNGDAVFVLDACNSAALSQKQSAGTSLNANPFSQDRARALLQAQGGRLEPGGQLGYANVFSAHQAADPPPDEAVALPHGTGVVLHTAAGLVAAGLEHLTSMGPVAWNARVSMLSPTFLYAGQLQELSLDEQPWLRLDPPADLHLDTVSGTLTVHTAADTRLLARAANGQNVTRSLTPGTHQLALPAWTPNQRNAVSAALQEIVNSKTEMQDAATAASEAPANRLRLLWQYRDFQVYNNVASDQGVTVSAEQIPMNPTEAGYPVGTLPEILHENGNVMFPDGQSVTLDVDLQRSRNVTQVVIHSRQLKTFNGGCGVSRISIEAGDAADGSDLRRVAELPVPQVELPNAKVPFVLDLPADTRARRLRIRALPHSPEHNVYLDSIVINARAGDSDVPPGAFQVNGLEVADLNGDGIDAVLAAGSDRAVHAVDGSGKQLWRHSLPNTVNALALFRSAPGTAPSVAAACDDHQLYTFGPDGTAGWSVKPPPRTYARPGYRGVKPFTGRLTVAFAADLDQDGGDEILIGSANWRVYCYAADGTLRWDECCWAHTPTCGTACDLDGNGTLEVVMGNSYTQTQIYSSSGTLLGTGRGSHHAGPVAVACADTNGNGKAEMVVGDKAGKIWFQEWQGDTMPDYTTGMDITAVTMTDLDGDGLSETLVASQNFLLYAFDSAGQPLWRRNLLEACRDIQCHDMTGDGRPELLLACEDGSVRVLDATGAPLAVFQAKGWIRQVRACELDGNPATRELVASCDDGSLYALQLERK